VFDEPTSSLSEPEAQQLFKLIEELKRRGVTLVYVSHRMPEIFRLCDRLSVLRDGKYVGTLDRATATQDDIVRLMIGRSLEQYFPQHLHGKARRDGAVGPQPLLAGTLHGRLVRPRAGEILGFAGLVGSGRSEVAKAIMGLDKSATGRVDVHGRPMRLGSIREAMRRGLGLVPEDRKRQGLVLMMSGRTNTSMAMLDRLRRMLMLDFRRELDLTEQYFAQLRVKTRASARRSRRCRAEISRRSRWPSGWRGSARS
jgi:ABC-type sugar transport system ATPase subunit